ncbi:MAG: hypothetical protein K0S39_2391 [Paenibacillus sp.]|nr:hypothetical protein [Paenibacillus sp.]
MAVFSFFNVQLSALDMKDGNLISVDSIKLEDQIAGMTVTYMEKGAFLPGDPYTPVQIHFSGDKTLTGIYRVSDHKNSGKQVCLYPDKDSLDALPKLDYDNKIVCLLDQPDIINSFPDVEGTATITINGYQILHFPDDRHNAASITSVSF